MKDFSSTLFATMIAILFSAQAFAKEAPVQHKIVADMTSIDEAKEVFKETTAEIKSKTKLDAAELHDIHMITYSL